MKLQRGENSRHIFSRLQTTRRTSCGFRRILTFRYKGDRMQSWRGRLCLTCILAALCIVSSIEGTDPGEYNSDCKQNSDCQLGFVCIMGTCTCESSFVYDMSSRRCKKVCRGSSEGFVRHGSFDHQYAILKNRYTNCSYVDGNLELTALERPFDLGFLKDIEEVDGYVFIVNVFSNYLNLTKLRIIRGKELFKYNNESYSLYVALNNNPNNDSQGILELQFLSLSEIVRGKVFFQNNNLLCFVNTIEWTDINTNTLPAVNIVQTNQHFRRQCPPCPAECFNKKTGEYHCWGSGNGMCQKLNYIKKVCSESCDGRCFGDQQNQCCHPECAAGCTGPKKTECLACKNFYNEGSCDRHCPLMTFYNPVEMRWENNPLGRYAFGSLCVKECPLYLVKDQNACVLKCPKDKQPDPQTNICEKCDGPCKKNCIGTPDFLNSNNIEQFRGCTVIDGNLIILKVSFEVDTHLNTTPLTLEHLSILKDVREINGYLSVQELPKEADSLSFLSGLEIIHGRFLTSTGHALNILKTESIEYLGLVSLRQIRNGGTIIMFNRDMCYLNDLDMSIIHLNPKQKLIQRNNKIQTECEAENKRCDPECSEHGCWGPGPGMCLRCRNKRLEGSNKCVTSCDDEEMQYEVPGNMCRSCDEQCAVGCHGPNATQCTACKYVKFLGLNNTSECMSECPAPTLTAPYFYPDETKICRQCDPSCDEGCTGNQTHVGFGGCKTCVLAINRTQENDTVRCIPKDQENCPDGYFSTQYKADVPNHPLNKKQVCQPCDHLCLTCTTEGVANCPLCRYYRSGIHGSSTCVKECPIYHFNNSLTRTCDKCNDQCLGDIKGECHGPTSRDCNNCQKYKIIYAENNTFECVTECPAYLPELVEDTVEDRQTMTVCAGGDHPIVQTRLKQSKEEERKRILTIAIPTTAGIIILGLLLALFGYYWRQREQAKENTIKLTSQMLGGLPESEPLTPSDAKPDLSKLRLIKESELRRGGIIGSGAFGTVYKGFYIPTGENVKIPVAIKVLQEGTSPNQNQELLEEARVMASVDHPCCIRILAVCMASQMMLITQLMPLGCLLEYIKKHKENTGSKALLNWCTQIARGMGYLEERGIVHRDLAARNVLVQSAQLVKITDFGLAKLLEYDEDHFQSSGGKMPIKWLALECIQNRIFTHKSDVWSFGVTVWELFTYGGRPYESVRARDVPELLEKGERLPQPPICTIDVYMIMIKCWMLDAESRPSFSELAEEFAKMARDPGRYLVIQGDELKKIPSEELLDSSSKNHLGNLINLEGDTLMRLPSISYDKDELARHLSVAGDGDEIVIEADEYLQPAPPPPLEAENNNFKQPISPGASNRPWREKRYGHLESAAAAKQHRDLSPNSRLRGDSIAGRYSSDPVIKTSRPPRDTVDGPVLFRKSPTSPSDSAPPPRYAPYQQGLDFARVQLPLDEDDYLQPKSANPKAYLELENNRDYYLNDRQMSHPSDRSDNSAPDDYLLPSPVPHMFENPEYFDGDGSDSVFDMQKSPPHFNNRGMRISGVNGAKPKTAPKPKRLTDYYNDPKVITEPANHRLLSNSSNCSSAV
ncbi:epidermal growth factor receptor-like isoform X1 [Dreissena polymorpha]|nr:epidermal growth factor receptor-like isoform X1 [Dreissena polymorpha]